jgi:hypothetical protein
MAHLPSSSLERVKNYNYTHPEQHYNGLTLALENESVGIRKQRAEQGLHELGCLHPNKELCWSCGWSTYLELTSSYGSRVRIMHARDSMGMWAIGSQWILRDRQTMLHSGTTI